MEPKLNLFDLIYVPMCFMYLYYLRISQFSIFLEFFILIRCYHNNFGVKRAIYLYSFKPAHVFCN